MWFFSEGLLQFNKQYNNLFGIEDEENDEEGEDGTGEAEDSGDTNINKNSFEYKWGWISSVDVVSETIREPWSVVFKMNVVEFLNILSYTRDKANEKKRQMEKYKNKIKNS